MKVRGKKKMTVEYLLQREVDLVLAALTPANRIVMRVMLHTGLRIGDVLALRTAQIKGRFWITEQKTGKRRCVGLPADLRADILAQAGDVWAFPGRSPGKPRTRQAVWKDVKRAAKAFRLPVNVGTHSARKVFAVDLMREYGDIDRVAKVLNHSNMATTFIYAMADMQRKSKAAKKHKRS